jgi:hypothetical protein
VDLALAATFLAPVLVLALLLGCSLWVLRDAGSRAAERHPVTATVLGVTIDEPFVWAGLCLVLFILAFPLYLAARAHS